MTLVFPESRPLPLNRGKMDTTFRRLSCTHPIPPASL